MDDLVGAMLFLDHPVETNGPYVLQIKGKPTID